MPIRQVSTLEEFELYRTIHRESRMLFMRRDRPARHRLRFGIVAPAEAVAVPRVNGEWRPVRARPWFDPL